MSNMEELIELSYKSQFKIFNPPWHKIYKDWQNSPRLADIEDESVKITTAMLLDNQWLFSTQTEVPDNSKNDFMDVVAKVYPNIIAHKIVSVQPMLNDTGLAYSSRMRKIDNVWKAMLESEDVQAKTRKLKALRPDDDKINVDLLSSQLINEINGEIIRDLNNNVGTIGTLIGMKDLVNKIHELKNVVYVKSGRMPNWLLVNTSFYEENKVDLTISSPMKVHVDDNVLDNVVLMGWQGDVPKSQSYRKDSAYVYCPYIPLSYSPVLNDPDFVPKPGFLTRYGKRLMKAGAATFAKLCMG
jgi:hypothetical protein